MAGDVVNFTVRVSLKRSSDMIGNYHLICHYTYNLSLPLIKNCNSLINL